MLSSVALAPLRSCRAWQSRIPRSSRTEAARPYAGEILHRVIWGEGAQVSPAHNIRNRGVSPGTRSQERMWPQAQPLMGTVYLFTLKGLTAVMGEGVMGPEGPEGRLGGPHLGSLPRASDSLSQMFLPGP